MGVLLGVLVAFFWGSADTLAALATRRFDTFKTTFISQAVGMLSLLLLGSVILWFWDIHFTQEIIVGSALIGLLTGACATLGYFALYQALELGPIALVSPISSTSAALTLILSVVVLQQWLTPVQTGAVLLVIFGVVFASTNLQELRSLLTKSRSPLFSKGVRWAIVAMLAFGVMDFGTGASAVFSGWFLPVWWTRTFGTLFLILFAILKRQPKLSHPIRRNTLSLLPRYSGGQRTPGYALARQGAQGISSVQTQYSAQTHKYKEKQWSSPIPRLRLPAYDPKEYILMSEPADTSLPGLTEIISLQQPHSKTGSGMLLAAAAGLADNVAVVTFSLSARLTTTGITAALASSYSLIVIAFGLIVYRERLHLNQYIGIALFMIGLLLLALSGTR